MTDTDINIVAEADRYPGESFGPEEYEQVKTAVYGDGALGDVLKGNSVLIVGSYNEEELARLETVKELLEPYCHAYLMSEIEDIWQFWVSKFKLLVSNSDLILGVYEHSHGGHEWEAGYLDTKDHRDKTVILKRRYPDIERQRDEPFDAMMAHWIKSMRHINSVIDWELEGEETPLPEAVEMVVEQEL